MPITTSQCFICGAPLPAMATLTGVDRQHGAEGTYSVVTCERCGVGTTLPLAAPEELAAFYPETYVPHERPSLLMRVLMAPFLWGRHRTAPFDCLRDRRTGRLLDIGCGRGDLGEHFIKQGWSVSGLDFSQHACEVARSRGVDAQVGTLESAALPTDAFDVAVLRHVLEHVRDPVDDLRRALAVLKPGGQILITLPNYASWQRRRFGTYWFHLDLPRHRFHFTPRSLCTALEAAGFEVEALPTSTSAVGLPASFQYRVFGHCVFQSGSRLLGAYVGSVVMYPLTWLADRLSGQGDFLHAVARKPLPADYS